MQNKQCSGETIIATGTLFELGVNLAKGLRDEDKDIARLLAHRDDPETSRKAAEKMVKSGKFQCWSRVLRVDSRGVHCDC